MRRLQLKDLNRWANAALKIQNRPPFVLSRREAVYRRPHDDLVVKGQKNPIACSPAALKIDCLRHDNADQRLTSLALARIGQ